MREHERFGRPPTLRPRSAAHGRGTEASVSSISPALLAARASAAVTTGEMQLKERLQSPRPGMVGTTGMQANLVGALIPGGAMVAPNFVLSKPPMRPKSAALGAQQISRQRLERTQVISVAPTSSSPCADSNQINAVVLPSSMKFEGSASSAVGAVSKTAESGLSQLARKRPSSAAVSSAVSDRLARTHIPDAAFLPSCVSVQASTAERPCSAGPSLARRDRRSELAATAGAQLTHPKLDLNNGMLALDKADIMRSEYLNTFVYAVPRHCLNSRLRYDPYDIEPISRGALFDANQGSSNESSAKWDFYTVSASGFTFYPKNDPSNGVFQSTAEWETQRQYFEAISRKPTFQLFRYRKVFVAWKKWIRATKMEAGRVHLLLEGFFSHPLLLNAVKEIRAQLNRLDNCQPEWDFRGKSVTIDQFAVENGAYMRANAGLIQDVHLRVQSTLVSVSRAFVDDANATDSSLAGNQFGQLSRKCSGYHQYEPHMEREMKLANADERHRCHDHFREVSSAAAASSRPPRRPQTAGNKSLRTSALINDIGRVRWTMAAIQRRKCAQLARFAQMIAFLELDTFEAMVRRNGEMVHQSVLRGANAAVIRRLTDPNVYEVTVRVMARESQREPSLSADEAASPASSLNALMLTRTQLKRLLRSIWESAFRPSTQLHHANEKRESTTSGASNDIWDQSKFEAAFFQALALYKGQAGSLTTIDMFSPEDIPYIARMIIGDALVLQPFQGDTSDLFYAEQDATSVQMNIDEDETSSTSPNEIDEDNISGHLRGIGSIAPMPLFCLQLELCETNRYDCEIRVRPSLDDVVTTIQDVLRCFLDLFKALPSLLSHPTLRSVLNFAEDLLASTLLIDDGGTIDSEYREQDPSFTATRVEQTGLAECSGETDSTDALSTFSRLEERLQSDPEYRSTCSGIVELISSSVEAVTTLANRYLPFLELHVQNEAVSFDDKARSFRSGSYQLRDISNDLLDYQKQIQILGLLKSSHSVQFIHIGISRLVKALLPSPTTCLETMHALLPVLAHEKCTQLLDFISSSSAKIQRPSSRDLTEFTRYLLRVQDVYDAVNSQESELVFVQELFALLRRFQVSMSEDISRLFELCDPEFSALRAQAQDAYASREGDSNGYTELLTERIDLLQQSARALKDSAITDAAFGDESCYDSLKRIGELDQQAAHMVELSECLAWTKGIFSEMSSSVVPLNGEFDELNELAAHLKLKVELWQVLCDASEHLESVSSQSLRDVDLARMTALSKHMRDVIMRARPSRGDTSDALVLGQMTTLQHTFEGLGPVVRDLRNPVMEERHWTKLERKIGNSLSVQEKTIDKDESVDPESNNHRLDMPISHLLAVEAIVHATSIRHVSEEATAEAAIAESFESVWSTWEIKELPTDQRKDRDGRDTFCVGDCDDLIALMEESEVLLRVMDFSSYARVIQERLTRLLADLTLTKDTTDLLQTCQQRWDHTQQLLSADFVRSFPDQSKLLQKYDNSWRAFMANLSKRPLCLPFGVSAENRQLLLEIVKGFDVAAKALGEHLEMKRQVFPAFFRLSNAELATLLAKARDVHDIQPFLPQCFDNVGSIVFGTRDSFQDILSVVSRTPYPSLEVIDMGSNLKARGPPEQWLSALEKRLVERLRRATKQAVTLLSQFKVASTDVKASDMATVESLPLQSLLLADQIVRCELVNEWIALQNAQTPDMNKNSSRAAEEDARMVRHALTSYSDRLRYALNYRSSPRSSRSQRHQSRMSGRAIILFSCLQLQEIQFRDALSLHVGDNYSTSISRSKDVWARSIPWKLQLQYRLDDSTTVGHECHVQLNTLDVLYGFNYVDPFKTVVMTPSSLRYLFALSSCIRNAQAIMLEGPSEAGKTTLVQQVSSILGRRSFCTVVTPSLKYTHVARLLVGSLYSGGSFCVQFQHVTGNVPAILKMLATQLAAIERAVLAGSLINDLHRSPITFLPGTALLVTCTIPCWLSNQYSADNVRAWTEPMAQLEVVAADHKLVLEAMLEVNGFGNSGELSSDLLLVYNQARSICSMDHAAARAQRFDSKSVLPMRVLKAAIQYVAGRVKWSDEEFERPKLERYLLRNALLSNVRTIAGDEEAYGAVAAIVNTVFCNEALKQEWFVKQFEREDDERHRERREKLTKWVHTACAQCHFTPRPQLIQSSLTLASHMRSHIGTILAGPCGTGKTTAYLVLAKAMDAEFLSNQERLTELPPQQLDGNQGVDSTATGAMETSHPVVPIMPTRRGSSRMTMDIAINANAAVQIRVVLPGTLTLTQLYGSAFTEARKDAASSVLGRLIREAQELYSSTAHANRRAFGRNPTTSDAPQKQLWVVFDGNIEAPWIETLTLVLRSQRRLNHAIGTSTMASELLLPFESGEFMTIPPNLRFVFESLSLAAASPSLVASNAVLPFENDGEGDVVPSETLHRVFLSRFFAIQRAQLALDQNRGTEVIRAFGTIERRLIDTDLLARLETMIEEYSPSIKMKCLQRVQGFVSLLQAVLQSIVSLPTDDSTNALVSIVLDADGQPKDVLPLRIAMGLVYSLLWGFAACISDSPQLLLLVSNTVKSAVPEATPAWSQSSLDINLFETIADFIGMRFVHIDDELLASAAMKPCENDPLNPETEQSTIDTTRQRSFLFVPTLSSLLTHATMKESMRTGRTVLLVGGECTRRTTLLRNLMQQMANLKSLLGTANKATELASDSVSPRDHDNENSDTSEERTLESINRIRFHQISLVMVLAARFNRERGQETLSKMPRNKISSNSLSSLQLGSSSTDVESTLFHPTWTPKMATAVQMLDTNNVIPFFFGMTQHDHGALELASCMERMLQRERAGVFEPPPGKAAVLLIDDLHLQMDSQASEGGRCEGGAQIPYYPSCYDFLRSATEHNTVFTKETGVAIGVENLFTVASTSLQGYNGNSSNNREERSVCVCNGAFVKLAQRCFPVLAPPCSSSELCNLFATTVAAQMDGPTGDVAHQLATAINQELQGIVASTVVLWERLRGLNLRPRQYSNPSRGLALFSLHDLTRVFYAIGGVEARALEDNESLVRLWTHECIRTFQDQFVESKDSGECCMITSEVALVKDTLREVKQLASYLRATASLIQEFVHADSLDKNELHKELLHASTLHELMCDALASSPSKEKSAASPKKITSSCLSRVDEESSRRSHPRVPSILWAFVPEAVYFDHLSASKSSLGDLYNDWERRSSRALLHHSNYELNSLVLPKRSKSDWLYAELVDDEFASREAVDVIVQKYFSWIASTSSGFSGAEQMSGSARWSELSLQSTPIPVPLELAYTIARIERVRANSSSKLVLLGSPGSGCESLLRYIDSSWQPSQRCTFLKLEGTPELESGNSRSAVVSKWRGLLCEMYERVGMDCGNVTLLVKRLDLIPTTIINQLLSLMVTGDVPGAFTLDDQIKMATKVRDERLVEIEANHKVRVAQIQRTIKTRRECEFEQVRKHEAEYRQVQTPAFYDMLESKYRDMLDKHIAQAQLQFDQEMDDFVRLREVETESVTATIMSLMRPLGVTSGKWQQIIERIRKRLSVVVVVDYAHEQLIRGRTPQLFTVCSVIGTPVLDIDALRVLVYGHFLHEVRPALHRFASSISKAALANFMVTFDSENLSMDSVKPFLWVMAGAAAEMHLAASREFAHCKPIATSQAWSMVSLFSKLLARRSREIEVAEKKEQLFLDTLASMEAALGRLRKNDNDLPARIASKQNEITLNEQKAVEQQENAHRIRDIMLRFQEAAEEQVRITNEMQDQAQRELQIPLACVEEANAALMMIEKRHIVEIKSFTSPPLLVHLVLDAICVLFRYEPTWENARKILSETNVVQTLLTFDKDSVPVEILNAVKNDYLSDERFNRQDVERQSVAASMMVVWVRAVHQYASARLLVMPALDKLEKAQTRLKLLMQEFQVSKERVTEAEVAWKATAEQIAYLEQEKRELTARSESRAARLEGGQLALEFLEEDRQQARLRLASIQEEKGNWVAWWNALLDASSLMYTGCLPYRSRARIFGLWRLAYKKWSAMCTARGAHVQCVLLPYIAVSPLHGENCDEVPQAEDESVDSIDPLLEAHSNTATNLERMCVAGTCFSRRRLHDAFLLSIVATTPGLFVVMITEFNEDIETLIVKSARGSWRWTDLQMVFARAPDFDEVFVRAVRDGHQLLVIDVEPRDTVGTPEQNGLRAVFEWQMAEVNGQMHLNLPLREGDESLSSRHLVPIDPKFKLVLTSHLGQEAFGDSLSRIPVVRAELSSDEIQDALLDQLWTPKEENNHCGGVFSLEVPLRDAVRTIRDQDVKHGMLMELTEAAASSGDFQAPQIERVRDQCTATKEGRLAVSQLLAEIRRQVDSIKKRGMKLAHLGATAFNAFGLVSCRSRESAVETEALLPLALQTFLPLFFRALKPSPKSAFASPAITPVSSPVSSPKNWTETSSSPRTLRSAVNLTRQMGRLMALTRQGNGLEGDGVPSPAVVLSRLLRLLGPLISTESLWHHFLTVLFLKLDQSRSHSIELTLPDQVAAGNKVTVSETTEDLTDKTEANAEATTKGMISMRSVLTTAWIQQLCHGSNYSTIAETLASLDADLPSSERLHLATTLLSRCIGQREEAKHIVNTLVTRLVKDLASIPTRDKRVQILLCAFPELVPLVCQKATSFYGAIATPNVTEASSHMGKSGWATVLEPFPESIGAVLVASEPFGSFPFIRNVFFGVLSSLELRVAVLKHVATQGGCVGTFDSLAKPYQLPRSVLIAPESPNPSDIDGVPQLSRPCHLLLTLGRFHDILELEKKHIDALETIPMALINMSPSAHGQESWDQLFRILYRSFPRATSVTQHRIEASASRGTTSSAPLARLRSRPREASSPTSARLTSQKSSKTYNRASSSRSVLLREAEAASVTPSYPRLLSVVTSPDSVPRHLRKSVACIQTNKRLLEWCEGGSGSSLQFHLQVAMLRIVYYPFEAMLCAASKLPESVNSGEDSAAAAAAAAPPPPSNPTWPPKLGGLLAAIALFHAILSFRHKESIAVAESGGGLPQYSDDSLTTSVGQIALLSLEFSRVADKKVDNELEDRCGSVILGAYARSAHGEWEENFLQTLLHDCTAVTRRPTPHRDDVENVVNINERCSTTPRLVDEHDGSQLTWLSFPVMPTIPNLEIWLDEMSLRLRSIDQTVDLRLRAELFGVSQAFNAFEEGRSSQLYPWVYQLGACDESAMGGLAGQTVDSVLQVIHAILTDVLPTQDDLSTGNPSDCAVEPAVTLNVDLCTTVDATGLEIEFLDQIQKVMQVTHVQVLKTLRRFFETLAQRIEGQAPWIRHGSSITVGELINVERKASDTRLRLLSTLREDRWAFQQVTEVMNNQIPTGLRELLVVSWPQPWIFSCDALLDEMLEWMQAWHCFLHRQQPIQQPNSEGVADASKQRLFYRWWTPAVEAFSIPIPHILHLLRRCAGRSSSLVSYTLRVHATGKSADDNTLAHDSNQFIVLEGLWLYGASWNEELGWLEPATSWSPQPVALVGTRSHPLLESTQLEHTSNTATASQKERSTTLTAATETTNYEEARYSLRFVPLQSAGASRLHSSTCFVQWEIRASPNLSILTTPYLSTCR